MFLKTFTTGFTLVTFYNFVAIKTWEGSKINLNIGKVADIRNLTQKKPISANFGNKSNNAEMVL